VLETARVSRRTQGDPYLLILPLRCLAGTRCGDMLNIERGLLLFEAGLALARDLATNGRFPAANMTVFLND
jgi:hypothetical protein